MPFPCPQWMTTNEKLGMVLITDGGVAERGVGERAGEGWVLSSLIPRLEDGSCYRPAVMLRFVWPILAMHDWLTEAMCGDWLPSSTRDRTEAE